MPWMISPIVTVPLPSTSNAGQLLTGRLPSTMLTPVMMSDTVTVPLSSQSPTQPPPPGVAVGVAGAAERVAVPVAVGVGVSNGLQGTMVVSSTSVAAGLICDPGRIAGS